MSRDEQRAIVERATILRGTVGSTVHGLRTWSVFEHYVYAAVDAFTVESYREAWGW